MPKTNDFNRALFRDGRIALDERAPTWWLSTVGDVSLWPSDEMGPKFPLPDAFAPVREHLAADVAYVNLEGPVTDAAKALPVGTGRQSPNAASAGGIPNRSPAKE